MALRYCDFPYCTFVLHVVFPISYNILYKTIEDIHVEHQAKITQLVPEVMRLGD